MRKMGLPLVLQNGLGRGVCKGRIESWRSWSGIQRLTVLPYSPTCTTRLFLVCVALIYVPGEEITGGVADKGGDDVSAAGQDLERARTDLLANWSPQWTHL